MSELIVLFIFVHVQRINKPNKQLQKFYVDDVLKGTIWTIMLIVLACLSLQIVRKYKQAVGGR